MLCVKILFFAKSRDLAGCSSTILELDNEAYKGHDLVNLLVEKYPRIDSIKYSINLALNENYVDMEQVLELKNNDEIAIIPPISGELKDEELDLQDITNKVSSPDCGAISVFIGTTRNSFNGKKVLKLEYEAFDSMALKEMEKICNVIREKWKEIKHIAIYHRKGEVSILKPSIIIAISSPHRRDSLEAVSFCIDEVKKTVPIWKKEWYDDSTFTWKENCECLKKLDK